jgi:hypothetical protein
LAADRPFGTSFGHLHPHLNIFKHELFHKVPFWKINFRFELQFWPKKYKIKLDVFSVLYFLQLRHRCRDMIPIR